MFSFFANFFSDFLFNLILPGLAVGILLIVASYFLPPLFEQYKILAKVSGIVLVVFFVFQGGRQHEIDKSKIAIAQQAAQIAELKQKSAEVTVQTVTKFVDKIKYVDRIKEVPIVQYVPTKADTQCVIDPIVGDNIRLLYNSSLKGILPDSTSNLNGKTN